jgi:uncharacterized oligopeptide transporter (OPT) family protein
MGGFGFAAVFHLFTGLEIMPEDVDFGAWMGFPPWASLAIAISFASLGAGLLSGKGGLPFVLGGVLAWWIIAPLAVATGMVPGLTELSGVSAHPGYDLWITWEVLYEQMLRPLGIGILIGGALSGVVASFPALKSALTSISSAAKAGPGGSDELPAAVLYWGMAAAFAILLGAAILASPDLGLGRQILTAGVGMIWLALAGLIVAQATGMTDISPLSGMSLIGVTLMFFMSGGSVVPAIILGVAVCVGIGQCADMMQDLKSGHLIGATPRKQQIIQFAVCWLGVPIAVSVIFLLWGGGGGFGPENPELSAPQGQALAAIMDSLQAGAAPLDKYLAGAAVGLGLGIYPIGGVGVLVGLAMYLPFSITLTYGLGCVISMRLKKKKGERWMGDTLVPVAAGFIIGEALTSLCVVLYNLATG